MSKMVEALKKHLNSLSEEELEDLRNYFKGPDIPDGWVSIEDHLPKMKAGDIMDGYTKYLVKDSEGNEFYSKVSDHNIWYYEAKESGITHWFNKTREK